MARSSVLKALKVLSIEDIQVLSNSMKVEMAYQKVSGDDFTAWELPQKAASKQQEADVLEFPKILKVDDLEESIVFKKPDGETPITINEADIMSPEILLWRKQLSKNSENALTKSNGLNGYKKLKDALIVKNDLSEGQDKKDKIRFAATVGVLINKKQA